MTIKVTPTQETILKAAADREDGAIHPMPKNIKGGAEKKVVGSLKSKGLAEHPDGDENQPLRITNAGRTAIGLEPLPWKPANDALEADVETAEQNLGIAATDDADAEEKKAPKEPRPGTKKARVWEMLRREEGATTQQIMDETGWGNHTVRGLIALAKKAGWNITTQRNRVVGPNQVGSPGSSTTYFLAESS